jgi:hypothetical protein
MTIPTTPYLRILGNVTLEGSKGPQPERRKQELLEMLLWLLEYPGHTNTQLANQLALADSTTRAYLCWLRHWLGKDPHGNTYIPAVKDSRIRLLPAVRSDHLEVIKWLGRDPLNKDDENLIHALDLVRGPVCADIPRARWRWAEPLRYLLTQRLLTASKELIRRKIDAHDHKLAFWACQKGLMVCPWEKSLEHRLIRLARQLGEIDEGILEKIRSGEWIVWNHTNRKF